MHQKKYFKIMLTSGLIGLAVLLLILVWIFKLARHYPKQIDLQAPADFWGVTYSKTFASFLGLNWREAYLAILDDLAVKNIRLPLYWPDIEKEAGVFDFSDYDWLLDEGAKRGVDFIVVLGRRQPRWPECHIPVWAQNLNETAKRDKLKTMLEVAVKHFQNRSEIKTWQVENEPLLDSFGLCPSGDYKWLQEEIALVKNLDTRPVLVTASGELSNWRREAQAGDLFGTTVYRVVWGPLTGYIRWPLTPNFYVRKLKPAGLETNKAIIAELQAEPWAPNTSLNYLPSREAKKSLSLNQLRANLQFAINTDFKQAYLWGVEWWYLEKLRGQEEYWQLAKSLSW